MKMGALNRDLSIWKWQFYDDELSAYYDREIMSADLYERLWTNLDNDLWGSVCAEIGCSHHRLVEM